MVDWQKYLANELTAEEMSAAQLALESDPQARAELEGLKRFHLQLQELRNFEKVPVKAIQAKYARAKGSTKRWPGVLALSACALIVLAVGWIAMNPPQSSNAPFVEKTSNVTDPVQAMKFLKSNSMVPVAVLDPSPNGKIKSVAAAGNYVKYNLEYRGKDVELMVVGMRKMLFRSGIMKRNGNTYFVNSTSSATTVIWRIPGMEFIMRGPAGQDLWNVVDELQPKTVTWAVDE